jgi:nitroreductase
VSAVSRVLNLSRNRQAVKRFSDRMVPPELLARIMECARYAPSAREDQPWRFIVVQDALTRHRIARAVFQGELVRTAPVLVIGCARVHSNIAGSGRPSHPIDLAAATEAMVLAAADMSLATAWITGFREGEIQQVLGIPADVPVVTLLALGYPDGFQRLPRRRADEETIAWDRWEATGEGRER